MALPSDQRVHDSSVQMVGRNGTHRSSLTVRSRLFAREVTIGPANLLSGSSCGLYWRRAFCPSTSKNAGSLWRATERGRQYQWRTRTRGRGARGRGGYASDCGAAGRQPRCGNCRARRRPEPVDMAPFALTWVTILALRAEVHVAAMAFCIHGTWHRIRWFRTDRR
jgi:hypothetical protein